MFAYFSFLHRRTDFYLVPHPDDIQAGKPASMGFKEGDAEKLLIAAFRQFPLRRIPKGQGGGQATPTPSTAKTSSKTPGTKGSPPAPVKESVKSTPAPSMIATTEASAGTEESEKSSEKKGVSKNSTGNMADVRYNEEGLQIPVGNGGSTKEYKWTQTIEECSVLVGVPKDLRGKDLAVKITATTLSVKSKMPLAGEDAPRTFVHGTLIEKVRPDESTWSIEGGVVVITLDKIKKALWDSVLEGDEKIDTELVDNRRHISEYDNATQAQIRKVIFDQEQYHKGGPTSDEILGTKQAIPPLPSGVEFIDRKKLDEEEEKKKLSN